MREISKLSELEQGEKALVMEICSEESMGRRLQELGLIKGTEVTCVRKSPLGDPVAFLIRGALIALRLEDASCVKVQNCEVQDWD